MSTIDYPIIPVPGMSGGPETLTPESRSRLNKDKIKKAATWVGIYLAATAVNSGISTATEYLATKQVTAALTLSVVGGTLALVTAGMVIYYCKPQLKNSRLFRHCPSAC